MFQIGGTIMKNLNIVLMITIVLGMAGCDMGNTPDTGRIGVPPPPPESLSKAFFDNCLEKWTEHGISEYSFDVIGTEYKFPYNLVGGPYGVPPDVKFCAHVTVADNRIVSIENIEPDEMTWLFHFRNENEMDPYTWGAIPDIFDKILSISREEESSPYAYDWRSAYDRTYGFPKGLSIYVYDPTFSTPHLPLYPIVSFEIENFQVNIPKQLEKWTKQGILNYSFDVAGYEYEPMSPIITGPDLYPPETKFCAHVTVTNGSIVSIENIEPDKRSSMSMSGITIGIKSTSITIPIPGIGMVTVSTEYSFNPDRGEVGAYTWGAIPDIFDKIFSIVTEEASSPYTSSGCYEWDITFDKIYGFPNYLTQIICPVEYEEKGGYYHDILHKVLLFYIRNFKVTENTSQ
jgi:hypothetical protein